MSVIIPVSFPAQIEDWHFRKLRKESDLKDRTRRNGECERSLGRSSFFIQYSPFNQTRDPLALRFGSRTCNEIASLLFKMFEDVKNSVWKACEIFGRIFGTVLVSHATNNKLTETVVCMVRCMLLVNVLI